MPEPRLLSTVACPYYEATLDVFVASRHLQPVDGDHEIRLSLSRGSEAHLRSHAEDER